MTTMEGLAEFLLARAAEDEAVARTEVERLRSSPKRGGKTTALRRVLECAAKRQIVERAYELIPHLVVEDCWYTCPSASEDRDGGECCDDVRRGAGCDCGSDMRIGLLLKILAQPYGDHPDWREEWRP